jgi:pimeloyl-ACP methyl ester carboxylesterase
MVTMFTVLAGVSVAGLLLATGGLLVVWRHPIATFGWLSRRALRRTGLRQEFRQTGVGRQSVWTGGQGPAVVLLHGAGDQAGTWASTARALLPGYRVVALDLAGHGDSEPASGPLSVGTVVDGVAAVLSEVVPTGPCTIVGNSLGAWVALLLAVKPSVRVDRLVLVNGGALKGDRTDITFTPSSREEARLTIEALMGSTATRAPGFVLDDLIKVCRHGPLGRLTQTAGEMDAYVLEGRLHEVRVPVDLLWGEEDRVFPVSYAKRMLQDLRAARLTLIPGCGHAPHRSNPRRFNQTLALVLGSAAPEATRAAR